MRGIFIASLRGRAKVVWAIRVAYTHGNGHKDQVDDNKVRAWIERSFVRTHFRGVELNDDVLTLMGDVTYPALRTALTIVKQFT